MQDENDIVVSTVLSVLMFAAACFFAHGTGIFMQTHYSAPIGALTGILTIVCIVAANLFAAFLASPGWPCYAVTGYIFVGNFAFALFCGHWSLWMFLFGAASYGISLLSLRNSFKHLNSLS